MSDKYRQALQKLLPPGAAWTRDSNAEITALLQGLAVEPQRVEDRGVDLFEEIDPRTTDELLPDWERVAGLPGSCQTPVTVADRREVLHQLLLGHGDPNLAFWQDLVEAAGFTFLSIEEYRPFSAGDDAGDHVIGTNWVFSWVVSVGSRTAVLNAILQCTLESLAQIHTVVEVHWQPYAYWTAETAAGSYTGTFQGVAHDGTAFCAVGISGEIQTSPDGSAWTHRTAAASYADLFRDIGSYAAGSFVAVGHSQEIQRSVDSGASWIADSIGGGFVGAFYGIAAGTTVMVAVGTGGEIQTSPVGGGVGTWTRQTADDSYSGTFATAVHGGGVFVIAGASAEIQWSDDDGVTWNHVEPDESYTGGWNGSTYANGYFWLVGDAGEIQQSVDGQSWRRITNDKTTPWNQVCGDGVEGILLVGQSKDLRGRTRVGPEMLFTTITAPAGSDDPNAIVVYGDVAVAVGDNGLIWSAPRYGS